MSTETFQLHVAFLPFMAHGHLIPTLDVVHLFAACENVKTTIITTPLNAPNLANSLAKHKIAATSIHIIPFPWKEAGLPEGIENFEHVTSKEMSIKFLLSMELLRASVEKFLEEFRPDCLIAGLFFPFTTDLAAKFGIPSILFHGINFFAKYATAIVQQYKPHETVLDDDDEFDLPNFPHQVTLTKSEIWQTDGSDIEYQFIRFMGSVDEAASKSYGEIFNSFYELEPDYVDLFRDVLKRKVWHIGPLSLRNRKLAEKSQRGKKAAICEHECLKWLDSKTHNSVIYICFGSSTNFSDEQLKEIALALESAEQSFIWVLKEGIKDDESLPVGFENRMVDRGLIIRGWAPQLLILEHESIGGFMTHCGWNSTLESISAGVPMVTWPVYAEQFYNEKLVTNVLKIGIKVGSKVWNMTGKGTFLKWETIEVALKKIIKGDEALIMRKRAKELKDLARKAVEEGGSSHCDFNSLINELISCKTSSCGV